jgi:hypothetical protein
MKTISIKTMIRYRSPSLAMSEAGSYRVNGKMHVVGLGDYKINDIQVIGDPCPEYKKDNDNEEEKKEKTKGDIMVGE